MKNCNKCKVNKTHTDFYQDKLGYYHSYCKQCLRAYSKIQKSGYRKANIIRLREYDRNYSHNYRVSDPQRNTEQKSQYNKKNPEKIAAHRVVARAIKKGELTKSQCEFCDSDRVHAHHEDYAQPLVIRWLCALHHKAQHIKLVETY